MPPRRLTPEQTQELISLYEAGVSGPELASRYDICPSCVYRTMRRNGSSPRRDGINAYLTKEQIEEIPVLYKLHGTLKKTAAAMGVHYRTIHRHLQNRAKTPNSRRGRLSEAEKARVLSLYRKHGTYDAVERETGISGRAIKKIVLENNGG